MPIAEVQPRLGFARCAGYLSGSALGIHLGQVAFSEIPNFFSIHCRSGIPRCEESADLDKFGKIIHIAFFGHRGFAKRLQS